MPGELRFAKKIESSLSDDCLCWYDIPVGKLRRYPDFIILHPDRGLLFLEVKDWKVENIRHIDKTRVELLTDNGVKTLPNPMEQVRQSSYEAINQLEKDLQLLQSDERYKGKLCFPYGWGVVLSNITRKQLNSAIPVEIQEKVLPPELVICSDEMTESLSKNIFEEKIWGMFRYKFKNPLDNLQIDRIRWHLFPEIRITQSQPDLFQQEILDETELTNNGIPEIIRILDIQQEVLARSLGEGHRVIHGVAGSGKTLILLYRCIHLAQVLNKPILVLCFNITLAARLKSQIAERGLEGKIQILHFHGWCADQTKKYNLPLLTPDKKRFEQQVDAVIKGVEDGQVPAGQYGAILVDEGHDFDSTWLSLVTKMVDPETNSLLFLYDDAQSIYKKRGALSFSLASVGIQAQGRTSILKLNYRNTKEILNFSYNFSKQHFDSHDDKHMAFMQPEAAGIRGTHPELKPFTTLSQEVSHLIKWIKDENASGTSWNSIAVLCPSNRVGKYLEIAFSKTEIPYNCLFQPEDKKKYNPSEDKISILPLPSSKGLEFHSVAVIDSSYIMQTDDDTNDDISDEVRRLYVGFTRAKQNLLVTWHTKNSLSESLEKINRLR